MAEQKSEIDQITPIIANLEAALKAIYDDDKGTAALLLQSMINEVKHNVGYP
jgi:hypothetical protein